MLGTGADRTGVGGLTRATRVENIVGAQVLDKPLKHDVHNDGWTMVGSCNRACQPTNGANLCCI